MCAHVRGVQVNECVCGVQMDVCEWMCVCACVCVHVHVSTYVFVYVHVCVYTLKQ